MNMNNRMKIFFFILVFSFVCSSCEKDQDAMLTQLEVMKEQFTPSHTSIAVECQLNTSASIKDVYVQYAASEKFADYQEIQMLKKDGKYSANITDLEDNTTYYIRYSASNRYSSMITKEISSTKTLIPTIPEIQIQSITNVLNKSADVLFDLIFDGGASITQLGICWSTSNNPSVDSDNFVEAKDNKTMVSLSALQENSTYYVRAYAKNKMGISYSESKAFTTLTLPKVQTNDISSVQLTSALLNALLLSNGNDSTITKGFCWGESTNPTLSSSHIEVNVATPSYTYQLSNLKDETKYHVRAYAKNKIGISYGEEKSFTTTSAIKPTVTTSSATNISYTSATVGGNITSDGGATVTERGICYSKSSSPTLSDSKFVSGSGIGTYTTNLTGLLDGTTYYVRAYAINKKGVAYGEQKSFTTKAYSLPSISSLSVTNIYNNSVTVSSNVTNDGGSNITERGFVYSTYQNPTISNTKVKNGTGTGDFTCNITNLQENTNYYLRAYAVNSKGIAYSQQVNFTTKTIANTLFDGTANGYTYVDLGLSVKWATCNIGARESEDFGEYLAWGETNSKTLYWWGTYKWYTAYSEPCTKYFEGIDNRTQLSLEDDAAHVKWGSSWRMPTDAELTELCEQCVWRWVNQNGIYGYNVTSQKPGYTNKYIFLPAAGYCEDSSLFYEGSEGYYWSSSLLRGNSFGARCLRFTPKNYYPNSYNERCIGFSVRPVYP